MVSQEHRHMGGEEEGRRKEGGGYISYFGREGGLIRKRALKREWVLIRKKHVK